MKIASLLAALLIATAPVLSGAVIAINPSADTFIWTETDAGPVQANIAQGASGSSQLNKLYLIRSGSYVAAPLLRFDFSSYTGLDVIGDATLTLEYSNIANGSYGVTRTIDVMTLTEAFDPQTTTYANYGTGSFGSVISTFSGAVGTVGQANGTPGSISFVIPEATLQSWIDSPASHVGIALFGRETANDIFFYSADSAFAPVLSFAAVPEPSTFAAHAGGFALAGVLVRRRRR